MLNNLPNIKVKSRFLSGRKYFLLIAYHLSLITFSSAQAPLAKQWDKTFGGIQNEWLFGFQQTADGGYILAGHTNSDSTGDITEPNRDTTLGTDDYWMIKTDYAGNKLWEKRFGGNNFDYLLDMQQTSDGGYILGGTSYSGATGDKSDPIFDTTSQIFQKGDYWIVKTDSLGNKQWDKSFGGCDADQLTSVQQTPDGGYILGGTTMSDSCGDISHHINGYSQFWVVKTDSLGNMQWDKCYGGNYSEVLQSLRVTPDGGYMFSGFTESDASGDVSEPTRGAYDYWFLKTDAAGVKQWDKRCGGLLNDFGNWVKCTHDGGYIMSGTSSSDSSGDKSENCFGVSDGWVVKLDAAGNQQWDKTFGGTGNEPGYSYIMQTSDEGYLFSIASLSDSSGNKTENNIPGYEQTWIVKTDSLGTIEWDKTIFVYGHCASAMTLQANDGCYLLANFNNGTIGGYKTQPNWDTANSAYDLWMIKFCDSTLTTGVQSIFQNPQSAISIYPNPAAELLVVNGQWSGKEAIEIYDMFGRKVLQNVIRNPKSEITINISSLSSGIYFLHAGNKVRKFIKK